MGAIYHDVQLSSYKLPLSVLVVIHAADLRVLLLERVMRPGYWQSVTGSLDWPEEPLEDCLTDLSWREAQGHVFAIEGFQFLPADEVGELIDVMISAAEFWAGQGKPFFAVFIDPERLLGLADLFRET